MFRFVFFAALLPLSGFAEEADCMEDKPLYRAILRHIESGGIGYDNGYTTFAAFVSPAPNQGSVIPFLDVRGHVFDDGRWAANAGIGGRALWGSRIYGLSAYYDYRSVSHFHSNQIGVGLETLGERWDFRMNGYLPVGAKLSHPYNATFDAFSGHYMLLSQKIQSAMKGSDAEIGVHFGKSKSFDFYAAAGPYYFIGEVDPATWGGKARLSGTFKDMLTLEISDSYDRTFHNKFQGQISLSFSLGPKSKEPKQNRSCKGTNTLYRRMQQPVGRQEVIVIDNPTINTPAIDPATGQPYFFVFVDNTSSSNGTYESPYHNFTQVQDNSSPNDIIYVFPGNGTSTGMNSGITLKANQKLWGSGVNQSLATSQGIISVPAQSSTSPTITNTNIDTEGHAVTLATNNAISGFIITTARSDAIYGVDVQNLEISQCTFQNTTTYPIEASFSGATSISVTNNQFLNNVNGIFLTLGEGIFSVNCSDNTFEGQTSVSSVPLEIVANNNRPSVQIQNNLFNDNTTGSIRFSFTDVVDANINVINNTITNNGTGSQSSLGSSFVILTTGTTENCSLTLNGNTFSDNTSNALYLHTSGAFTNLAVTASTNTMSGNGGSALVLATPTQTLTLTAIGNTVAECNDNGIAIISAGSTTTGTITINNNSITEIGNSSNGIAVNQDFASLNLTISNNEISGCEGTGIVSYSPTGINSLTLNISENTVTDCQNLSSNAASGLDIEQYTTFVGSVTNNTFSDNLGTAVFIGSTLTAPTVCLTLSGNANSADYTLSSPVDGTFNLSPCNVDSVNTGTINPSGIITSVQSCPEGTVCPR